MTRIMAPYLAKQAGFFFRISQSVFNELIENMCGKKTWTKLDFGYNCTCLTRVMAPYSAKMLFFSSLTLEVTFLKQS